MDNTNTKVPLTENTVIGSVKITKQELKKFFMMTLGEEYKNHTTVMEDALKRIFVYGTPYIGITLKEIMDNRFNPSWFDAMGESVTSFRVQKKTNAKIEDVIPHYLDGNMQNSAMNFVAYLQTNKMPLKWDAWNTWKAHSKGKVLCWITLHPFMWVVSPCLTSINDYEEIVINERLQHLVWDNFKRCSPPCRDRGECRGAKNATTILGKEFNDICNEVYHVNNKKVDFSNPDETTISSINKLLELENAARVKNSKK